MTLDVDYSRSHIRASLSPRPAEPHEDMLWLTDASPALVERIRAALPQVWAPAAVLIPLVEREAGWTVLLTQRAATLKDHAGQISFPGGRVESQDADAWGAACRETLEEIGLVDRFIEFAGYLPDHWVGSGFRITPAVGFIDPAHTLRIAETEVHDVFEVPLRHILDAANHTVRMRRFGTESLQVYDIPFGDRLIWGATAGMLLTLRRLLTTVRTP